MELPIVNQSNQARSSGVTLTQIAGTKVSELLAERGTPEQGLRIGIRGGGCSGNSYFMEFCESPEEGDEVFLTSGVKLVVDRRSLTLLQGTEIDFVDGLMGSGFKFNNPNVRHSCACGESFTA